MSISLTHEELLAATIEKQLGNYGLACSIVVLAYDWLLVFDDEVTFIWTKSWSFLKCIYLVSRYTPWIDVILTLYYSFQPSLSTKACHRLDIIITLLLAIGLWISELILVWRTYVIWNKSRKIMFGVGAMWLITIPLGIYFTTAYVISLKYAPSPLALPGCYLAGSNFLAAGDFVLVVFAEVVIVTLTLIKGIQHVRTMTSVTPVIATLYRDGVLFFICMLVISLVNILEPLLAPHRDASISLTMFLRVMHSTLCCRVLLNIRTAALSAPSSEASQYPGNFSTCACTVGEACDMQHFTEYWELNPLRVDTESSGAARA